MPYQRRILRLMLIASVLLMSALAQGCVKSTDCSSDDECGASSNCLRGYCQPVCKTQAENKNGVLENLTSPCPSPETMRCVCVATQTGSTCSDPERSECDPTLDDYCLCFRKDAECNPRCLSGEICIEGACISDTQ